MVTLSSFPESPSWGQKSYPTGRLTIDVYVDIWTAGDAYSGLDLELGSSSCPGLLISSRTLVPVSLHLRSSGLEAGPKRTMIQRKLEFRCSRGLGS